MHLGRDGLGGESVFLVCWSGLLDGQMCWTDVLTRKILTNRAVSKNQSRQPGHGGCQWSR